MAEAPRLTCWKERFSIISMTICLTSLSEAALAAPARARSATNLDIVAAETRRPEGVSGGSGGGRLGSRTSLS